jgi:hypothetical protein
MPQLLVLAGGLGMASVRIVSVAAMPSLTGI